ncbi:glycoside hydrolase [Photobacterium sanguinicancri]|uniref:glycoside hydrolase n=1 Tax=Photobacterium sanguinicancri TaxID=875932 RepID=UPI00247FF22B|nr:glycoside hydrolase [Photobacterium sanguinicancri]
MSIVTKSFPLSLLMAILTTPSTAANELSLQLQNGSEQVTVSPVSLKLDWQLTDKQNISINSPALLVNGKPQTPSELSQTGTNRASWTLLPSKITVKATYGEVLELAFDASTMDPIDRNKPVSLNWFNLNDSQTNELYLPFSEGMRIPTDNSQWAQYLADNHSGANTTQDLKMPFWSSQQAGHFITVQLANPTNNELTFVNNSKTSGNKKYNAHKIDMTATHYFTALNQDEPFVIRMSIGANMLDGAKRYRQWRIKHGQAEPLTKKIIQTPAVEKMIGASQVYLFGSDGISPEDVINWWQLKNWYFTHSTLTIPTEADKELKALTQGKGWFSHYHKQLLVDSINASLRAKYPAPQPTLASNSIAAQFKAVQLRKKWLAQHAQPYLISSGKWGQALSEDMITALKQSGINKLWLGLDNWMPAFYQPEVVDKAKQAGYLVATYDSYNTAIPLGLNDGWLTAQLPNTMRKQCAIELADGSKKKGFRGNGYYLNPQCHLDYVQQRVKNIVKYGRFNSLFLDVDGTAMAREDYQAKSNESQMITAFNHRMDWIAKNTGVVLGSEDGNSLTTTGTAFAHGLETIGFGWTDKDMKNNKASPYYLGRWYPDHKPDFFFKTTKVKEPYKTLLFAPQYRVPLYQTVFHDEVINSHHWHSDSLKFSNVQTERDLISMLYNTPAMVHLSRDEAKSANSPRIKALKHYQEGYEPIHQQLWDKQLVDFKWLDNKGNIQQTRFSDGSTITANFSDKLFKSRQTSLAPHTIIADLSNGKKVSWVSK